MRYVSRRGRGRSNAALEVPSSASPLLPDFLRMTAREIGECPKNRTRPGPSSGSSPVRPLGRQTPERDWQREVAIEDERPTAALNLLRSETVQASKCPDVAALRAGEQRVDGLNAGELVNERYGQRERHRQ